MSFLLPDALEMILLELMVVVQLFYQSFERVQQKKHLYLDDVAVNGY
jgi:hypothetical protein